MGFLPSLRRGSDRWWLPCGDESREILGQLLVAEAQGVPVDRQTRQRLLRTLRNDPPLLIFTALSWPTGQASLTDLADWLIRQAVHCFAGGDAFLGSPELTSELQSEWRKLRDYFRTLPVEKWVGESGLWLRLTGPSPADNWTTQWPVIRFSDDETESTVPADADPSCLLQRLARLAVRHRSLEEAFDQQVHQKKLDALKQLAYGLSHEINNPLANISTRAQQLQRGETDPSRTATLQRIVDQVYRAHQMIADLMFYANPPAETATTCQVLDVLQSVADSFNEELERQSIRLEVAAPSGDIAVVVDAGMIGEAVRALIRNAIDAIGCQGTIVVSLVPDDGHVMIHVADSGPGLSDEARAHAFDPYFSGREAGRGLGLGLCRAYRIAKLHDGDIHLAGGPAGCVATLALPI